MKTKQEILEWLKMVIKYEMSQFKCFIHIFQYYKYKDITKAKVSDVQIVWSPISSKICGVYPMIRMCVDDQEVCRFDKPIYVEDVDYELLESLKQEIFDIFMEVAHDFKNGIDVVYEEYV